MRKHIMFTARDAGAAHQIKHVALAFKKEGFKVSAVASGPGYAILKEAGLEPLHFFIDRGKYWFNKSDNSGVLNKVLMKSRKVIDRIKPDAVFCGLSTFDIGIDEATMYWASAGRLSIPSFQFLDAWGTFNHLENGYPDMYFAIDRITESLGTDIAKAPIRVVGSPKHYAYKSFPVASTRNRVRKQLGLKNKERLIGYFGQDPDMPGHAYNFRSLVNAILACMDDGYGCRLLIRPHPAHADEYGDYLNYVKQVSGDMLCDLAGIPTDQILCACDIVTTCSSTAAVDHAYLSHYANKPIGLALYLLAGKAIKDHLLYNFRYFKNPLCARGIGLFVDKPEEYRIKIKYALNTPSATEEYFKLTKSLTVVDSCRKIMEIVSRQIAG